MSRRVAVRVPASSANLGPGYDVLAAAVSLELELEVEEAGGFAVEVDAPGVPRDRSNLCVRAFEALHPADGLAFRISSRIPPSAGLGSSAAAIVAGLCAAERLFAPRAPLLELATRLEGHPDNVAAALLGGFVVCGEGAPERLEPPSRLEAVIAIPPEPVPTAAARAALPADVPLPDAVHNVGRAALLVLGLERGDLALIGRGLDDRLHQPRRSGLYPRSMELVGRAAELGALGATISGAGPTVLFWCGGGAGAGVAQAVRGAAPGVEVRQVAFVARGAEVDGS